MRKSPAEQRAEYVKGCTHYRNGHVVFDAKDNSVVFDGFETNQPYAGVNKAKRYVRKHNLKSYTIRKD